ncbi:general substrate transporter [Rhexocercosporidium sp. MPI-PUGE-AT-0058]|nr:general substrate transporter [Rhexocercosporidium sp. MPI-PUGE-AT-0058]
MAGDSSKSVDETVKHVVEVEAATISEVPDEEKPETAWQMASQYRSAILWSSFIGLAGINWEWIRWLLWGFCIWYLADKIGKRFALGIGCLVSIGAVFVQVFAGQPGTLLVGKLINGLSLGSFLTIPSSYAAEICAVELRGLTTSAVQLFIGIGQLMANLILKGTGTLDTAWAYRIPFTLQLVFPVILLVLLPMCPESPWYLLRTRNPNTASSTLARLGYDNPAKTLAEMQSTITFEEQRVDATTYLDCFRGSDLRRTEIAIGIFSVTQPVSAVFVIGYSSYFFQVAGLSASTSFSMSVGVSILGLVGVVCSWFLLNQAGRRATALVGTSILVVLLLLIGILDVIPVRARNLGPVYGQVACIIRFAFIYLLTIGPVGYALFAEVASPRLRSRTVDLSIVTQNLFGILMHIVIPLLINPDAAALGGKIGFIFGGTAFMSVVWLYFRVLETAHRSFEELDYLFAKRVLTRAFKVVQVVVTYD